MIEFYLQNGKNRSLTRQHFQIKDTTFRHWLALYHHNGFNVLAVSHTKQIYSPEFKLSVVQAVKNGVFSTTKATLYFGIPEPALISQWWQGLTERNRYYIPTKVGSISWLILEKFANETASAKVCREKDIAWIIVQWTVLSGD